MQGTLPLAHSKSCRPSPSPSPSSSRKPSRSTRRPLSGLAAPWQPCARSGGLTCSFSPRGHAGVAWLPALPSASCLTIRGGRWAGSPALGSLEPGEQGLHVAVCGRGTSPGLGRGQEKEL